MVVCIVWDTSNTKLTPEIQIKLHEKNIDTFFYITTLDLELKLYTAKEKTCHSGLVGPTITIWGSKSSLNFRLVRRKGGLFKRVKLIFHQLMIIILITHISSHLHVCAYIGI